MSRFRQSAANSAAKKYRKPRCRKRQWIVSVGAFGAVIAFMAGNSRQLFTAYAAPPAGRESVVAYQRKRTEVNVDFNIPAGTLRTAIEAYRKQTGITVTVENPSILDVSSAAVVGNLSAENGLKQLLIGTGVTYVFIDTRSVLLTLRAEAASVEIRDSRIEPTSPKYTRPLRDTPQTINIIPKEVIEQQGATTLRDVLTNVPGITLTAGEGGAPAGDNLTIRGFSARNDIYIDGVRDLGAQSRDPFNLEQVEVVKGPSSTFTGRGSTGGTINLVSKLPNLRRTFEGTFTGGTSSTKRATADINVPIGDTTAVRLNLMANDSDFPGREIVQNRRWGVAPSVFFGLGSRTRLALSYFYIEQSNTSDYGIPWVPATNNILVADRNRPAPVPRSTYYGIVDRDKEKLRSDLLTARFERDFNDNLTLRNQLRYGYSRRDSLATPPRFASDSSVVINRELRSYLTNDNVWDNQTDLTARFRTGRFEHSAVFGASYTYENSERTLRTGPNSPTTLFNPNPDDVYTGVIAVNPLRPSVAARTFAAYLIDTVKLSRKWDFVGGLRWDRFDVDGLNVVTTPVNTFLPISRVDRIFSGRAALVYKPIEAGNLYASFGTSANPSLEGLLYQPADARLDPEKTRTFELGTKWDLLSRKLLLTAAVFRVQKTNARTPSLIAGEPPTLNGDQRIDGLEFSATGNFTRNWQVFSAYTLLDSQIVRSDAPPTIINGIRFYEVGRELINTPRNSFNLWSTYRWDRLFFGGGPRFVGKRYGNNINTRVVDSYWVADAMVTYQLSKKIDLRLNVNNISDKNYIDRIGGGHIIPGPGRVVMLTTAFRF